MLQKQTIETTPEEIFYLLAQLLRTKKPKDKVLVEIRPISAMRKDVWKLEISKEQKILL